MKNISLLFALTLMTFACCKKDNQPVLTESLVFGSYYGNCAGNCFNVFKMDHTMVQEDEIAEYLYSAESYVFTPTKTIDNAKYVQVKDLINQIPDELKSKTNKVYGCPDCYDQGGVLVQVTLDGKTTTFNLDNADSQDQSAEVVAFKKKIRDAIIIITN